jgi:transcriptional regulator NrdR
MMLGCYLTDAPPFHTIYLHGLVRDKQGRKMSKSFGNVVNPLEVMEQQGTDALRFTLATSGTPGQDLNLNPERIEAARLLIVKRDGTRQEFDRDKLANGLRKALTRRPVADGVADQAADEIEAILRGEGMTEVPSSRVGQLAMTKLHELDQIAYIRFASVYQSFEGIEDLKREVDTLWEQKAAKPKR